MTPELTLTDEELAENLVCRGCGGTVNGGRHLDECSVAPPEWGPRSEWPEGLVRWVCVSDCDVPVSPAPSPEELDRWQWAASAGFSLDFIPVARLITALRASREEVERLIDARLDLEGRLRGADTELRNMAAVGVEKERLLGKAEGVRLAISYLR